MLLEKYIGIVSFLVFLLVEKMFLIKKGRCLIFNLSGNCCPFVTVAKSLHPLTAIHV